MGIPSHRRPLQEYSPPHLPGRILKIHEPMSRTPKTYVDMKPHVKFWIAVLITGVGYFFYYIFPTLPEYLRAKILTALVIVSCIWEMMLMIYRGDADLCNTDDWKPSQESIFSYDHGRLWILGCSVIYLTIYSIRCFNKFIDNINLFKL